MYIPQPILTGFTPRETYKRSICDTLALNTRARAHMLYFRVFLYSLTLCLIRAFYVGNVRIKPGCSPEVGVSVSSLPGKLEYIAEGPLLRKLAFATLYGYSQLNTYQLPVHITAVPKLCMPS